MKPMFWTGEPQDAHVDPSSYFDLSEQLSFGQSHNNKAPDESSWSGYNGCGTNMVAYLVSRKAIGTQCGTKRATMVTRARGRFINRPTKTGRRVYDKFFIYVPTELARDSSFPVKPGQEVDVQIDSSKGVIVVQPIEAKMKGRQPSRKD